VPRPDVPHPSAGSDGATRVEDDRRLTRRATAKEIAVGHFGVVNTAAFSPDGSRIVRGSCHARHPCAELPPGLGSRRDGIAAMAPTSAHKDRGCRPPSSGGASKSSSPKWGGCRPPCRRGARTASSQVAPQLAAVDALEIVFTQIGGAGGGSVPHPRGSVGAEGMRLELDVLEGENFARKPVQRSLPPPMHSTVRVNLSASKSSSSDRGVPTPRREGPSNRHRRNRVPPQGVFRPHYPAQARSAWA
jgi:hypothetical protein